MENNYHLDSHKMFWHLKELKDVQEGITIAPIYIEISPVSYCNHHCNFCAKDFVQEPNIHIDLNQLEIFLKEAKSLGTKSIMLAGEGEPMLHKNFIDLVRLIKSLGLDIALTTNGSMGTPEIWTEVLPLLSWIRFSINGSNPEIYANVHRVNQKEFNKVITSLNSAIQTKKKLNLPVTIGVQQVVLQENCHELLDTLHYFTNFNINYFSFKPFSRNPQMLNDKNEKYQSVTIETLKHIEGIGKLNNVIIDCRVQAFQVYHSQNMKFNHCHALSLWGYIMANGDFYTCPIHIGNSKFNTGNINRVSPYEILMGQKREDSIAYGQKVLNTKKVCRINCRLARINEFLEEISTPPEHVNFI